jgi:hypothetical protein
MNLERPGFGRARSLALSFVFLHVFFAVRTALPRLVFCHKSGGRIAVEFETEDGCHCRECEQARADFRERSAKSAPDFSALDAVHCRHEAILSDVGRSSLDLPIAPSPGSAPAIAMDGAGQTPADIFPSRTSFRSKWTGPPGRVSAQIPLLRC